MPNARAATFIAERIPFGLTHPGDPNAGQKPFTIPLPGLRSTGIPPEMAAQFAEAAGMPTPEVPKLLGQAIVHTLETEGQFTVVDTAELDALRQAAADAPDGTRTVTIHCRCDVQRTNPLLLLTIGKGDHVVVQPAVFKALGRRSTDCPHEAIS